MRLLKIQKSIKGFTQPKYSAGFTLVETLIAITILLLVIIGPLTIAQKGIQNAYYANEQVTAVFLAQEAIEAVRELRDADALRVYDNPSSGDTWDWHNPGGIHPDCKSGDGCAFNINTGNFGPCGGDDCILKVDNGVYSHTGGGSDSPFTRKVYVSDPAVGGGVSVTVDVSWTSQIFGGATPRHVILQTWIYDHYQRYDD